MNARRGFSLLEVLVACGILVVGLASIAAILPAAGSRLSEASAQDRAAAAAAVAMSEIRCRNLVARDMFPGPLTGAAPAIVFGEVLPSAVATSATSQGYSTSVITSGSTLAYGMTMLSLATTGTLSARIQNNTVLADRRGYFLEDEVQYQPSLTGNLPLNSFAIGTTSGSGVRQFNRGICWGAMITPLGTPPPTIGSMTAAKVTVAVFRKPGGLATAVTLTSSTTGTAAAQGVFQTNGTPASMQRTILKPCSRVLGLPAGPGSAPQWLAIRSSWLSGTNPLSTVASATTCVVFENDSQVLSLIGSAGSSLTVIGFENLLLVNEQTLPVQ